MNLSTSYMGLSIPSPIIVSSSGLTNSVEKIKAMEANGAGAVVLKSLFEEQIKHESGSLLEGTDYPEAQDYINAYVQDNTLDQYLKLIREAKAAVNIPVIASINCVSADDWTNYAKDLEAAGADGLELNIYIVPTNINEDSSSYEEKYYEIVRRVKAVVSIPIAVKIGQNFTNLPQVVNRLAAFGAAAVVLFNRFYEVDIDTDHQKFGSAAIFSNPASIRQSLRWVGILSDRVKKLELSASTGVHDGDAVVKQLLAGAQTVQVCSVLYQKGVNQLQTITEELKEWMQDNGHETIGSFRASMNYATVKNPSVYERAQFMKYFSSVE